MTVKNKDNSHLKMLAAILFVILFLFFGCAGGKGFHMEIETGNDSSQRIQELAGKQMAEDRPVKDLPEITGDEYERMGDALLGQKKLYLAYIQYEKSLQLDPRNLRVEYKKGLVLLLGSKNEDAIKQFQILLDQDEEYAPAYEGMAGLIFKKRNIIELRKIF